MFALIALVLEVQVVLDGMFAPLDHFVPVLRPMVANICLIMVPSVSRVSVGCTLFGPGRFGWFAYIAMSASGLH